LAWLLAFLRYLLVAIWTMLRPRVALYLLPFAIPWGSLDAVDLGGVSLNSADILVFLLAASWLTSYVLRPLVAGNMGSLQQDGPLDRDTLQVVPRSLIFALLALLFAMLLSLPTTFGLSLSLKEISKWVEVLIVVLVGAQYIRTRRQIWTLVVILCLAAISQAFFGYLQVFFNLGPESFIRDTSLRVYGTFGQPNPYAGYINMTLTITLALTLLGSNWKTHILAGFTTILLAVALYLTQSRGGEMALAVALLFIVTLGMPQLRVVMRAGAIGVLAVIGAYFGGLVPTRLLSPVLKTLGLATISLATPNKADFSTAERLAHWIAGANMFLDHPLFGVGIGNYSTAYPQYFITIFLTPLGHAHNYYINIAAEAGMFGLIGLLAFLVAAFIAGGQTYLCINQKLTQVKTQLADAIHRAPTKYTGSLQEVGQLKYRGLSQSLDERRSLFGLTRILSNDRALAVGLLAALLSVCVHNLVDDLYVHSMTSLFALLIVILIRLRDVAPT
jgi:O-antigen ligase